MNTATVRRKGEFSEVLVRLISLTPKPGESKPPCLCSHYILSGSALSLPLLPGPITSFCVPPLVLPQVVKFSFPLRIFS